MKPGWHPKTFGVAATNVGGCIHLRQYLVLPLGTMTVLEALAILEAAVLECKKRDVDTPEVKAALDFLEPYVRPQWLIPQYRDHVLGHDRTTLVALEGQQQVLRATFPGIRDSVKELIGKQTDALARNFAATHDMKVKDEIETLA
jgi:hypothetical protein